MEPDFTEKERKIGGRVIIETLYNDISVYIDKDTGYYYADKICSDNGKEFRQYMRTDDYQETISAISATVGNHTVELIIVFEGMPNNYRGRWIHPLLVHPVCEWANKKYAVLVSMLMNEKAKQAIIEKRTLQEQVDVERARTQTMEAKLEISTRIARERDIALKKSKNRNKRLERDNQSLKEKVDELLSVCYQSDGKLDEANAKIDELLCYSEARDKDCILFKSKMNSLNNKISNLNASNFDEDGTVIFIWTLFRSESMTISYNKPIPENAIWVYSSIREDKNKSIPDDAEVLFEANVVSRSMYESLVRELESMTIDTFYRHILISYENAIPFIDRLNELLAARGIHPETYNIDALNKEIETIKAKDEIKRKRALARAQQIAIRQRIIDEGNYYIYIFGRWRRLYNKNEEDLTTELTASKFFYVRTGAGGVNIEHIQTKTLEHARF